MSPIIANRICIYCGERPPFDNWVKITFGTGWIHASCVEPMRAVFARLITPQKYYVQYIDQGYNDSEDIPERIDQ